MYPPKKKPRKDDDDTAGDQKIILCDCCKKSISAENDHIRNNPCGHNICLICFVKANMNRVANPAYCQVRDCHQKYTISCQYFHRGVPGEIIENGTIVELGSDEVAWILSFLPLKRIMCLRRVNMTWREAAKKATVPPTEFWVNNLQKYNALNVMTRAMPNLQQITLSGLGRGHKYNDGEDPNEEEASSTAHRTSHDIEIISNFRKLRRLTISTGNLLNGRYPVFFNSFPLLQKLNIKCSYNLKWYLGMLAGLPSLKELNCPSNPRLTGNINSLRVLKDTLEKVKLDCCYAVEGNFMDLADFPNLKELDLYETAVTGDIRDIGADDFPSLEFLGHLPKGVFGGWGYELQSISDAPDLIRAVYLLKKQRPALIMSSWSGKLSDDSPDWYDSADDDDDSPPFYICFVEAGSRFGYRWETKYDIPCEMNWLDPEPDRESSEYEEYIEKLQEIKHEVTIYKGYHQPPTEEEYQILCISRN